MWRRWWWDRGCGPLKFVLLCSAVSISIFIILPPKLFGNDYEFVFFLCSIDFVYMLAFCGKSGRIKVKKRINKVNQYFPFSTDCIFVSQFAFFCYCLWSYKILLFVLCNNWSNKKETLNFVRKWKWISILFYSDRIETAENRIDIDTLHCIHSHNEQMNVWIIYLPF